MPHTDEQTGAGEAGEGTPVEPVELPKKRANKAAEKSDKPKSGGKSATKAKATFGALKQLSNAASTGGAGSGFETEVQACFAALLATGGYAPALPTWPIVRV